jgi:hypothetical protein
MNSKNIYTFNSKLHSVDFNFIKTVVYLPPEVIVLIPKGRKKVSGLMNGAPFSLSLQYRKDGTQFFAVSGALREAAAIKPGDPVKVVFSILENELEIPDELETRPSKDDDAGRVWNGFTSGLQKGLRHYVSTVKTLDSRMRKSFEWVEKSRASATMEPLKKKRTKN